MNIDNILNDFNESDDELFLKEISGLECFSTSDDKIATNLSSDCHITKADYTERKEIGLSKRRETKNQNKTVLPKIPQTKRTNICNQNLSKSALTSSTNLQLMKMNCTLDENVPVVNRQNGNQATQCKSKWSLQPTMSNEEKVTGKTANVSPVYPPLSMIPIPTDKYSDLSENTSGDSKLTRLNSTNDVVDDVSGSGSLFTTTQPTKNTLTILVDSKEASNCQVISFLRRKHNINPVVSRISGCDYIVSTRMAVERKLVSDISNHRNYDKLTARVRELCDLYDRSCIVIEKDRVKTGTEIHVKCENRSKHFDRVLACLAQAHIRVLFSEDNETTSDILVSLAQTEEKKNHAIIYPVCLSEEKKQIVKFLSSVPRISYVTAISLCYSVKTLKDIINSSAEDLVKRVKSLSLKRANDIVKFFNHNISPDTTSCGGK